MIFGEHTREYVLGTLSATLAFALFLSGCGSSNVSRPTERSGDDGPVRMTFAAGSSPDAPVLIFATAPGSDALVFCVETTPDACSGPTPTLRSTNRLNVPERAELAFFKLTEPFTPGTGAVLNVVTRDAAGTVLATTRLRLAPPAPSTPPTGPSNNEPGSRLVTVDFPALHNDDHKSLTPIMRDVITHVPLNRIAAMWGIEPINTVHEELHAANSYARDKLAPSGGDGFYIGQNKAVVLPRNKTLRISDLVSMVPHAFRVSAYNTYIVSSGGWDSTPTYLLNEWSAYIMGLEFGIELAATPGQWAAGFGSERYGRPAIEDAMAFSAFALTLGLAFERLEKDYLTANPNFDEFLAYNLKRAMRGYHKAINDKRLNASNGSDRKLFEALTAGPDGAPLRDYAFRHFGEAWTKAVFAGQ